MKDTAPERLAQETLRDLGVNFRALRPDLPGGPDIVLPCQCKMIFIHGCFWHSHHFRSIPKENRTFWEPEIAGNQACDSRNRADPKALGWEVFPGWECEDARKLGGSFASSPASVL